MESVTVSEPVGESTGGVGLASLGEIESLLKFFARAKNYGACLKRAARRKKTPGPGRKMWAPNKKWWYLKNGDPLWGF